MLYNLQALREFTGFTSESRIYAWLNEFDIPHFKGKGGQPLTTLTQIDAALNKEKEEDNWEMDHGRQANS